MSLVHRLLIFAVLLLGILTAGTVGYTLIEGWPFLDCLYMTVITITTVGFKEVRNLSHHGMVFTVVLILSSIGVMAVIAGSLTQAIVAGQIRTILGKRRLERRVKRMKDHIIICGYGRIGSFIAREFHQERAPFLVIEKDSERIKIAEEQGYPYVEGDATDDDTLLRAGLEKAKGLIAALPSDADNLYITLSARTLKSELFIISRTNELAAERKLLSAGANRVVSPYTMGAARMANALLRPNVVDFIDLVVQKRHLELQLEEITVMDDSKYKGKPLRESGIRRDLGLVVVAIKKASGQMMFSPSSETLIEKGDILIVLGEKKHLDVFTKMVQLSTTFDDTNVPT